MTIPICYVREKNLVMLSMEFAKMLAHWWAKWGGYVVHNIYWKRLLNQAGGAIRIGE